MKYDLDVERLQAVLSDFYNATGVDMFALTNKGAYSRDKNVLFELCLQCESDLIKKCKITGKQQVRLCESGIINVVLPVKYFDKAIDLYLFFSFRQFQKALNEKCLFANQNEGLSLNEYYERLPLYRKNKFDGVVSIANTLSAQFVSSGIVYTDQASAVSRIKGFIDENYATPLTINDIARGTNVSKSNLYRIFKSELDCTPIEYLNKKRIEKSKAMLIDTEFNINEISRILGFPNAACFRSVFKKEYGVSPTHFKKTNKKY